MKVIKSACISRLILCLLILSGFSTASFAFQEVNVSSNESVYKKVVGGAVLGTDFVVVDNNTNFSKFQKGDKVLLIQMKSAEINVPETPSYGQLQDYGAAPGMYEFLVVSSTDEPNLKIYFTNNLLNNYRISGNVQLIWVPTYYSANVTNTITCPPWDSASGTGGVFAMIVDKRLTLNADIDVSAKGFRGGAPAAGTGICSETAPSYAMYAYDTTYTNSGFKGEGLVSKVFGGVSVWPAYSKGKGPNFNAGGGGNGRYSGGGGGSNYGSGGKGGREDYLACSAPVDAGLGGKQIKLTAIAGGLYMGGGGGGATFGTGTASPGGRGGGIVIILCNDIVGNGHSIRSEGEHPSDASGQAGSGGGGAGGSIAIYLESFSTATPLTISAKGGQGGNKVGAVAPENGYGEGGGGGGGYINISNITIPGNVTRTVAGGANGTRAAGGTLAGSGGAGENLTTYIPVLNGFLFNSIYSNGTLSSVDSVCTNIVPYSLSGTTPVGGSGSYTFLWQRKNDSGGSWTGIGGSNVKNYSFPATEADTLFIRRIVTDDISLLTDTSKSIKIIAQPAIQNNVVKIYSHITSLEDTVCFNQDPALIDQVLPDLVVPTTKHLIYKWQEATTGSYGVSIGTAKSYDPPSGLQVTKWYRRTVTSGRCVDSTAIVKVTVIDTISKNIITTRFDTICHGGIFANLLVDPGLGGGDGTYIYHWEYSQTGSAGTWVTIPSGASLATHNPDETHAWYPGSVYYRRTVYSGNNNVCSNISKTAVRKDWPVITGNTISADELLCSGSDAALITGPEPLNGAGAGSFRYTWQDSSKLHDWTDIAGYIKVPGTNYDPPVLTDTTAYRRIAYSSKCTDNSIPVRKRVHKPITGNTITLASGIMDSTICVNQAVNLIAGANPSGGTDNPANDIFNWQMSSPGNNTWNTAPGTTTGMSYQPGILTNATGTPLVYYYRRSFASGMCSTISDTVTVTVLPKITNNVIAADQAVCYNTNPATLTGPVLTGGAGGTPTWLWQQSVNTGTTWSTAANTSNGQNYSPPQLTVPTLYRRIIYSGLADCCKDTSNVVSITINPLPSGAITAATDTVCEGTAGQSFSLAVSGSTASPWNIVFSENGISKPSFSAATATSTIPVSPVIPGNTTDSMSFVFRLVSITDNNNCQALPASLTGSRKLVVWKAPVAGAGPDGSVCGQQYTLNGTNNVGTGMWFYPGVPVIDSTANTNSFTVDVDLTPAPVQATYTFIWKVANWNCKSQDATDITFYDQVSVADAGMDRDLYSFDNIDTLHATVPLVGTGAWTVISGGASIVSDSIATGLSSGENTFEWTVTNGDCISSDQMKINVYSLLVPEGFSPNGDLVNDVFEIKGLDLNFSEVTLVILNGAGAEVYRTSNAGGGTFVFWNGENSKGPLPDGTYYYLLTSKSTRNNSLFKKGGFVVMKRDKMM